MKASLNKSIRDAQIRDSFNKESCLVTKDTQLYNLVAQLYKVQCDLPRNASKLHSVVIMSADANTLLLLNFEVLRSVSVGVDEFVGFTKPEKKETSKSKDSVETTNENSIENEEEGGVENDN